MWNSPRLPAEPDLETLRKNAKILVIDDLSLPSQKLFNRDGYHIERWPIVKTLAQLTDNHFQVILLDVHGVGLKEDSQLQGLGILKAIKNENPAQIVVLYSSQSWPLTSRKYVELADEVLDKDASYVEYKHVVDRMLTRRASYGYYISVMNRELSDDAAHAPKSVQIALKDLRSGRPDRLRRYLEGRLQDTEKIDRVLTIISIGMSAIQIAGAVR